MKALVTGACGFVGGHLIRHLLEQGDTVMGGYFGTIVDKVPHCLYEKLDIRNFEECSRVIGGFHPDVIYHLAGIAFVPDAEKNFDDVLLINVGGLNNVLRIPHLLGRKTRVVHVSSAEVYGKVQPEDLPLKENQPIRPTNNYSLTKASSEIVAEKYSRGGFVESVVIRPFNHIGAGQNNNFVASNFAWQLARIAKGHEKPVMKVGNLHVDRDFSDVRDIVKGYRLAAQMGSGTYNLCSGKPTSVQGILDTLIKISGLTITIEPDPERMRPAEMPCVYGDYSRAKHDLGWEPVFNIEDTLREVYHYWLSRV